MKKSKIFSIFAVFFMFLSVSVSAPNKAFKVKKKATNPAPKQEQKIIEEVVVDADIRFGKILRIQDNIAFVQIISKIPTAELPPKFLVCDINLNPVAELESIHIGYKDCFLFKIIRGNAQKGDNVIVRYFGIKSEIINKHKNPTLKTDKIRWKN
ncbi:MAG: hypothetical protein J6B07_06185 [Opitutales bacterium]|nr:hypothetical protein [Opitutales bacterium]